MKVSVMQTAPSRIFAVVLDPGDEVMECIARFAALNEVGAAHFTSIGAFSRATLACYNPETGGYDHIPVERQVEVVSLIGNIAMYEGEPKVHAHAAVVTPDGSGMGGHLIDAYVRPTLEMFVTELPGGLERKNGGGSGLPLLQL